MINKIKLFIAGLQTSNTRSISLSILRIFICLHLLKKLILSWSSLDLLYGPNSIVAHLPIFFGDLAINSAFLRGHYKAVIFAYIILLVLYFFGIGKNFVAALLFLFVMFLHRLNFLVLNGGDNLLEFLMLYTIFADSYSYFSITKLTFKREGLQKVSNTLTNLACYSIILHLCLIYFVSSIHKLNSNVWFHGIAVYYTFSLNRFTGTPYNSMIVKNQYFVTIATYFTLFYELYFPVLALRKRIKPYYLLLGVLLHMGIYVFMMIYDFQFVFIFTYLVFFNNDEIRAFKRKYLDKYIQIFNRSFRRNKKDLAISRI